MRSISVFIFEISLRRAKCENERKEEKKMYLQIETVFVEKALAVQAQRAGRQAGSEAAADGTQDRERPGHHTGVVIHSFIH